MKQRSLRIQIAVASGLVSTLAILLFATLSIWRFYSEELEVIKKGTPIHAEIQEVHNSIPELITAYLVALPLVVGTAAFISWWLAGSVANPLIRLADAAEQINVKTLHHRMPLLEGSREIVRLGTVLNNLMERLEKSFKQSLRFAADASHELRTPLAVMRAEIETVILTSPSGQYADLLAVLLDENLHLSTIADKLLLLARADAGHLLPSSQEIDLGRLIDNIAEDFEIIAEVKGLHFEYRGLPRVIISGDEILLRQVFFNLFENAVKYNREEGWILTRLDLEQSKAIFSIKNSGTPIPSSSQTRLFERFFRAEESRNREIGGSGLGLSLCYEIIFAHGGTLVLDSSTDDGTIFILTLPTLA